MRTRTRVLFAPLVAALALALAGSLAGPAARADAATWLATKDVFHFPAWSPNGSRCIGRSIRLAEGYYSHGPFLVSMRHRDRPDMYKGEDIGIRAGWYGWKVCRWWNSEFRQYRVSSTLSRGAWERRRVNELSSSRVYGDGLYEWGGRLEFTEPFGLTHPSR